MTTELNREEMILYKSVQLLADADDTIINNLKTKLMVLISPT